MKRPSVNFRELPESAVVLRARRAATGLTMAQAAPLLGIARSTLSLAEAGFWVPTPKRLAELLAAYDAIGSRDL